MVFSCNLARRCQSSRTRCDDEGPIRTAKHGTQRFDGMFVDLAVLLEFRKVVNEGQVNDGIRSGGAAPQARNIFQHSPLHIDSDGGEGLRASLRTRQAEHLVPSSDQLLNNVETHKSGGSGDKNTHGYLSFIDG